MPAIRISPEISPKTIGDYSARSRQSFEQVLELVEGNKVIGRAKWICGADVSQGVVQILELRVNAERQRRGDGHLLMNSLTEQAKEFFKLQKFKLRRIWIAIEQKRQVIGRSFLMKFGFHHVGTVHEMLRQGEDMLIYMRTFD